MLSPLSGYSPLPSRPGARPAPPDEPSPSADEFRPEEPDSGKRGRKVLALGMLGLSGLAGLGAAGVHAAATLPVCQGQQQIVGWESGRACVSMDTALQGSTAWRYAQGVPHLPGALHSWEGGHNVVTGAPAGSRELGEAQTLKTVSWNLHHGLSQDGTGARPQLDQMVEHLQREDADVVLLQEVPPGDVSRLTQDLGMQGYYAQTTPVQGNLILLRPDIEVQQQSVVFTTGEPSSGWGTLKSWVQGGGGQQEPRNLQILRAELPDGQSVTLWNTHNMTSKYTPEQLQQAARIVRENLQEAIQPGDLVVGGGDLNANRPGQAILDELSQIEGMHGQQRNIDWIYSTAPSQFSHQTVEHQGVMVSDHPLVRAQVDLTP
jgi:endonuclease/exonuclease/phosphatase family metal-dependent hydrolase